MNITHFLLLNGIIGFFSDIILNLLSTKINVLSTLIPYFNHHSMFRAALYASITVLIVVTIIVGIYKLMFNKYLPTTLKECIVFFIITFIIGYIADIVIYRINIFPKLKLYYKEFGDGLWGALAILFSVVLSYFILYYYNK